MVVPCNPRRPIPQSEEATIKKPKSMSQAEHDEADEDKTQPQGQFDLDPLIDALLEHLPAPGDPFPDRKLWMEILALILGLIYPEEEEEQEPPGGQPT